MKIFLLSCAAILAVCTGFCHAANIISTFDGQGATPFAWSLDSNWNHNPASPGNFPKNGMGGNNYSVIIDGDRADLSEDITIDALTMTNAAEINSGGRVLTIVQPATLSGGIFSGGGTINLSTLDTTGVTTAGAGTIVSATATTLGVVGGGAGSVIFLGGGEFVNAGSFTIVNNGTLSSGTGGGTFRNQGSFSKTGGGGGMSVVGVTFDSGSGTVSVSNGELRFNGSSTWAGTASVSNGALLRLSGSSGIGSLNIALTSGSIFQFSGGLHTLFGTLTSTCDTAAEVIFNNSLGKISGGTLDLVAAAPFTAEAGELGAEGVVTNVGAFTWKGGVITGGGVSNEATTAGLFAIPASLLTRIIRSGPLNNSGHITQGDGNMSIGNNGTLHNLAGGTYLCTGAAVFSVEGGATTHLIHNEGTWRKTGTAGSTVFTRFKNDGVLQVQGGTLTLRGVNEFSGLGDLQVDRTSDATAKLTIGGSGLASSLDSPFFSVVAGGVVELSSGTHTLNGTATLGGSGKVEQTGGTLVVASNGGAISGPASAPFRINGSLAKIQTNGTLTNNGSIEWPQGILIGPGKLVNAAGRQILVGANARLSDSPGGSTARIENHGTIQMEEAGILSVGEDGILVNESGGRVNLPGTSDITQIGGTTGGEIQNKGEVVKKPLGGGSLTGGTVISTAFLQNVPSASLGSESGTLL